MNQGHATIAATTEYAGRHKPVSYVSLGPSGLLASQAGFGGYRVSTGIAHHEKALETALRSGINLIDTSANYADGGSETLVGDVLEKLIAGGEVKRSQIIVVSKVGYLQGENFAISQRRKDEGRPFPELVEYGQGLEHCIHPVFIEDQLTRSLSRLKLITLDGYLLHNPEYYLGWARKNGVTLEDARNEYYRRIQAAFMHLEQEVVQGRIRFYGISANTFPASADDPQFTCMKTVWDIAESVSATHHFGLVQMPFNLLETGAVLETNQPGGNSALKVAAEKNLGVLINRPLNAFGAGRLIRLADIARTKRSDPNEVIEKIRRLTQSEAVLWKKILSDLDIPQGLKVRIRQQNEIGDHLKHYWKNFGSYENFRQAASGMFWPRVRGVFDILAPHAKGNPELSRWIASHTKGVEEALEAVGSLYAGQAERLLNRIHQAVDAADPDWRQGAQLSQKAIRALRSTAGVCSVLVGMRREAYVSDVLSELRRDAEQKNRHAAWTTLQESLTELFSNSP